nr:hypothetical protein [uncultured Agathobaculum sp.]
MYNRYLAAAAGDAPPHDRTPPRSPDESVAAFSALGRGLSGRLQNLKLDMDTIIVLVIVWFLLSGDNDGDGIDWEQLILIGVLLLLGI